jgi:hypothetical protein
VSACEATTARAAAPTPLRMGFLRGGERADAGAGAGERAHAPAPERAS